MLYKLLILPIIDYVDITYDGLPQYNNHTLQKLQNWAALCIPKADYKTPIAYMPDALQLDILSVWRKTHCCIMVFKFLNDMGPLKLKEKFHYICD